MKLFKKLVKKIEKAGFSVKEYEDGSVDFQRYSPEGHDFHIEISKVNSLEELEKELFLSWDSFDVSEEAYIWLDEFGHGKNGAPYDMRDVYEDMEVCEGYILELKNIVTDYLAERMAVK